jgi:hypothetical protein
MLAKFAIIRHSNKLYEIATTEASSSHDLGLEKHAFDTSLDYTAAHRSYKVQFA